MKFYGSPRFYTFPTEVILQPSPGMAITNIREIVFERNKLPVVSEPQSLGHPVRELQLFVVGGKEKLVDTIENSSLLTEFLPIKYDKLENVETLLQHVKLPASTPFYDSLFAYNAENQRVDFLLTRKADEKAAKAAAAQLKADSIAEEKRQKAEARAENQRVKEEIRAEKQRVKAEKLRVKEEKVREREEKARVKAEEARQKAIEKAKRVNSVRRM